MKKKLTLLVTFFLLIFTGCADKQYFEPSNTQNYEGSSFSMPSDIKTFNRSGATLSNSQYLSTDGISKKNLPEGYEFVNLDNGNLIASDNISKVLVNDEIINIENVVIAGTLQNNLLALVFSNNSIAIYDTLKKDIVFVEYFKESMENDIRTTNPLFLDNLILFPTLDGRVIIVNKATLKSVKTIVVDANGTFNNIIFLKAVGDRLVAATNNKIIIIGAGALSLKDYSIREVLATNENIFLATTDGQVIKFDLNLNEIASKKYKFAKFYALAYKDALYALESQGYLVKINDDFVQDTIYDFSFNESSKVITIDNNKIYIDNEYLVFE